MNQSSLVQKQTHGSERYLWVLFVFVNILLMIDELRYANLSIFVVLFLTRLIQLLVAFFAVSAIFLKREISADILSLYILFLIAAGAGFSLVEPGELVIRLSINAFFYLLLAASYKGSLKDWLQIYLPVATFLLFAPVGLKASHLFHFENLSFVIASFVCSNGIVFVRQYINRFSPAEKSDGELIPNSNISNDISEEFFLRSNEENQAVRDFFSAEMFGCQDMMSLFSEIVSEKQSRFKIAPRTEIMLVSPRSIPNGWGIQAEPDDLKQMLSQLIEESACSLGMQTGFVRINIQFTLKQMHLIVEDNGRGLGKDTLLKLKQKNIIQVEASSETARTPLEMRSLLKVWGADFEFATRLGVGRRVCMSFPLRLFAEQIVVQGFENFQTYNPNEATMSH